MSIKERFSSAYESRHIWLLIFAFLCGSLLTLVYMPGGTGAARLAPMHGCILLSAALLFTSVLSLSVCGKFVLPLTFTALGVLTALGADAACAEYLVSREDCLRRVVPIALLVPVNFVLGVWGMSNSSGIRAALSREGSITKKQFALMYVFTAIASIISGISAVLAVFK